MMHPIERLRYIARAGDEPAASLASEAAYTLAELSCYEPSAVLTACRRLLERHPSCGPLWWVGANLAATGDAFETGRRAGGELCSDPTPDRLASALKSTIPGGEAVVLGVPVDVALEGLCRARPYELRVVGDGHELRRAIRSVSYVSDTRDAPDVVGYASGDEERAVEGAAVVIVEALAAGAGGCLLERSAADLVEVAGDSGVPVWALAGLGRALPAAIFQAAVDRSSDSDREEVAVVDFAAFTLAITPEGSIAPQALAEAATCPAGTELLRKVV